jgi:mycothiol synthase
LKLRGDVPERYADVVRPGLELDLEVDGVTAPHRAKVARVGPLVDGSSRTFPIEAAIDNADGRFKPGTFARARVVVGADEAAWLEVNNAAFAWHAEQGGWDLATLQQREHEPWFRPDGFLLHERDGRLAAFCWTKLHASADEATVGEIYVIAVHPDFHGLGLGKALTLAGLTWLHQAGAAEGMLYVDAQNTGAVAMYHALDFHITHTDQAYSRPPGGLQP